MQRLQTQLHKSHFFTLLIILIFLGCKNDNEDDNGCLGCGLDTTPQTEFTITGQILNNCNNQPAANRQLELYRGELDAELVGSGKSNENGNFNITYEGYVPADVPGHAVSPPYVLSVPEDSTFFYLPGQTTLKDMVLILNDSIDLNVQLKISSGDLSAGDSISYSLFPQLFDMETYGIQKQEFIINGPIDQDSVINRITKRWDIIEIDPDGKSFLNIYWRLNKKDSEFINAANSNSTSSKESCLKRLDLVEIKLD